MELLVIDGVDISHLRLVDLAQLADQARPFYVWVESRFQRVLDKSSSLEELIKTCTQDQLRWAIADCYRSAGTSDLPFLFDGVGRTYPHLKACYYFFAWIIRDAPQQRLAPLIQRIVKVSGRNRTEVEIDVLTALIFKYRTYVKTFSWDVVREVIIDRLEGSRRSIKGHEKEVVVRTALLTAIQRYFADNGNYGVYVGVEIAEGQVYIGRESYDVSANLIDSQTQRVCRILMPIKTRETEGGGHSHLFSRDIYAAINTARFDNPNDYIVVIIVAKNWSRRETEMLDSIVDHLVVFDISPGEFVSFTPDEQARLNRFVASVLDGTASPKYQVSRE